jgi:hypothetical protein
MAILKIPRCFFSLGSAACSRFCFGTSFASDADVGWDCASVATD